MAKRPFRAKRKPPTLDELGGGVDGGIAILDTEGNRIHMSPTRVTAALRYFLARVRLHDAVGLPARLALTSALAGEGVTYIARSLGAAIAYDSEASVAVVDFNWLRPRPAEGNDEARRRGLADVIDGELTLDDVILQTANPRLALVPPGELAVARRPAIARSERLDAVLEELDRRFDHLLLDLPPVLATSDAMDLTQCADAYVLVVRQGATSESQVEAALEELDGVETLGVILNRFDSAIPRRLRRLVGT